MSLPPLWSKYRTTTQLWSVLLKLLCLHFLLLIMGSLGSLCVFVCVCLSTHPTIICWPQLSIFSDSFLSVALRRQGCAQTLPGEGQWGSLDGTKTPSLAPHLPKASWKAFSEFQTSSGLLLPSAWVSGFLGARMRLGPPVAKGHRGQEGSSFGNSYP